MSIGISGSGSIASSASRSGVAYERRRQHEARQPVAEALGVARRDQPAHGVAHQHYGTVVADVLDQEVEVVHDRREVGDQRSLPIRAAVPYVVQAVHRCAALRESSGHVVVAADVLAVAVRDDHHMARLLAFPRPHVERACVSVQYSLGHGRPRQAQPGLTVKYRRAAAMRSAAAVPSATAGVRQPDESGVAPCSAIKSPASPSIRAVAR